MFDFMTLIQLEDYHRRMADEYNNKWYEIGDEYYIMCIQHLKILKAIRIEIEARG